MNQIKNITKIPILCGQKKFCYGQHKFISTELCDCTNICKMAKIIHISNFKCVFTNKNKSSEDCKCIDKCCANKSELSLYFK